MSFRKIAHRNGAAGHRRANSIGSRNRGMESIKAWLAAFYCAWTRASAAVVVADPRRRVGIRKNRRSGDRR